MRLNVKQISTVDMLRNLADTAGSVRFAGARWIVTSRGRPAFALVGVPDLERLESLDNEARGPAAKEK